MNPSWHLNLDEVQSYAYWNNLFTKKECDKIIEIAKKQGLTKGATGGNVVGLRSSKICWLVPNDDLNWAFRKITDVVLNLNDRFFKFNIFGLSEGLQFTNYKKSDKYGKHVDRSSDLIVRKLSLSIQLTDPKDYEGGELILYNIEKGEEMKKEQGTLILFPSYTLHEVKPVTKGERNSLVSWVTGEQFK